MRELHLPDGKPVVINPELIAYLYSFGDDATLIGFTGSATITVQGSYEDVLVELGLLDTPPAQDHVEDDAFVEEGSDDESMQDDIDAHEEEEALRTGQRRF